MSVQQIYNFNGIRQCDRFPKALSENYVKIDNRDFNDLIKHMAEYAKRVKFFNDDNQENGSWEPFFKEIYDYETQTINLNLLKKQMESGSVMPHLALMFAFLKLYQIQQNNLNNITERHLQFYYKDLLGFTHREGKIGNAIVFLRLNKNANTINLPKGTLFDAGKDEDGKTITFESIDEASINNAQIDDFYAVSLKNNGTYDVDIVKDENDIQIVNPNNNIKTTFGCAFSLPQYLKIQTDKYIDLGTFGEMINLDNFDIEYTSCNGWEKAEKYYFFYKRNIQTFDEKKFTKVKGEILHRLSETSLRTRGNRLDVKYLEKINYIKDFVVTDETLKENNLKRRIKKHVYIKTNGINTVPYNPKIHGIGYETSNPIIRFIPRNGSWDVLDIKLKDFEDIVIHEKYVEDLITIENKYGLVFNREGALPFGYECQKGDYFTIKIKNPCIYCKYYKSESCSQESNAGKAICQQYIINEINYKQFDNNQLDDNSYVTQSFSNDSGFPVYKYTLNTDTYNLHTRIKDTLNDFRRSFTRGYVQEDIENELYDDTDDIDNIDDTDNIVKQDEPKVIDTYYAIGLNAPISFNSNIIIPTDLLEVFSITPWKINKMELTEKEAMLFPLFSLHKNKTFTEYIIAISNLNEETNLNLFFELSKFAYKNNTKYNWYYLQMDKWEEFSPTDILKDGTENFTRDGIVQIHIMGNINPGTSFPSDKLWLKISPDEPIDISKETEEIAPLIKDIKTQAVDVQYSLNSIGSINNKLFLPKGSITKLSQNIKEIKKVEQPLDGYIGLANETEEEFKSRVSEKLRHKGRAWNRWDYEHIVLEHFPQIAAVKCIPCDKNPGTVTLLLFPNINLIPQNDIMVPMIDHNTLKEIEKYIKSVSSPFVTIQTRNLSYIKKKIDCSITLKKGYNDKKYYQVLINNELKNYLAPWQSNAMNFDFNRQNPQDSDIIYFLENLEYVDYVEYSRIKTDDESDNSTKDSLELEYSAITTSNNHLINIK